MISEIQRKPLALLTEDISVEKKLQTLHRIISIEIPGIQRIAVALYEPNNETLKTYLASDSTQTPLLHYEVMLKSVPGLSELREKRKSRVIHDLDIFSGAEAEHSQKISSQGFGSSYTSPMFKKGDFLGFIFYNSLEKRKFSFPGANVLDIYSHLITEFICEEKVAMKTMVAAFRSASRLVHFKDPETGNHLERMALFSRLMALKLAQQGIYHFSDSDIEYIFTFAPLHDIGKISIPDDILLKPGSLTPEERVVMQTHTTMGGKILEDIMMTFNLSMNHHIEMLRNIVELHHETIDGKGYPYGKSGDEIPMETRIIAVADVFDALTSERPYKEAWPNEDAFAILRSLSGEKLDAQCVNILIENQDELVNIQGRFQDDPVFKK